MYENNSNSIINSLEACAAMLLFNALNEPI